MIAAIFFGFFALYLYTCAPHLAPYRDAGEMVSLLGTLGVAHPPGYPLYSLIGKMALDLPFGNPAYRANVFSALCAAGALTMLYLTLRVRLKPFAALVPVLLFGLSNPFWDLATVSEMYALGLLWFSVLLFFTFRHPQPMLFGFLMALGLGVRMDMLLLVPIFLAWMALAESKPRWFWVAGCFAAGASVFLYLMVRSRTDPVIDWGNPDTLLAVFNSARRKSYSGTLDLLSLSYGAGENFGVNLGLYAKHLVSSFGWWGIGLTVLGAVNMARKERRFGLFCLTIFFVTGPLFLFLANMPPNPHSVAIVEASYPIPDLMLAVAAGFALPETMLAAVAAVTILILNGHAGYARASKRHNLYVRDYVENVMRSLPNNSVAAFHKDVQLFSLWEAQLIDRRRPDVSFVATGLSASPWYWEMRKRWETSLSPEISLKEDAGWTQTKAAIGARPFMAGYDVDMNERLGLPIRPQGLLMGLQDQPGDPRILSDLCLYRGLYKYNGTPDFFSTDLIGDHARAHHQQGFYFMLHNKPEAAEWFLRRAESLDPTFARATADRGYLHYLKGDLAGAVDLYGEAARKGERTLALTTDYKSLPDVVNGVRGELSAGYTQWGAVTERLGHLEDARNLYIRALSVQENAQAHYNLAVTYWGKDWTQVISHMRRAVELNPQMNEARAFLAKAMALSGQR